MLPACLSAKNDLAVGVSGRSLLLGRFHLQLTLSSSDAREHAQDVRGESATPPRWGLALHRHGAPASPSPGAPRPRLVVSRPLGTLHN